MAPPARPGARLDWMEPFARTIDAAKKYVVSSTLERVDWNAELVRGDLGKAGVRLGGGGDAVRAEKIALELAALFPSPELPQKDRVSPPDISGPLPSADWPSATSPVETAGSAARKEI
jgi:hypothetical protein